ncbi:MAG: DUF5674 family protein [Patescibacteria group bacterium]|nr:DUF5674 family protein [Patescibacteria group bacterium]
MKIITKLISLKALQKIASDSFGTLVKAVVDVEKEIMVIDGELHADEEALLLKNGSQQKNLWGINLYPGLKKDKMVEFDSMINLRPSEKNFSRNVENQKTREKILKIVQKLVKI